MTTDLRDQLQGTLGSAYSLDRELAGGGMSRVFVAEESALGRRVVIKVLAPELAQDVSSERFAREIRVAASLQQANIVPLLSAGTAGGLPYYTMPFVEGESLRARLARDGPLPITDVVGILRDVAKALAYAHEHGVVHRDIKPDNVLLSGGTAVVTDFGIAKAIAAAREGTQGGATLTQVGTSLGTPAYMAPEQSAADPQADHRVDIYAFGVMAYELLAGQPPFHGRSPHRLLAAQMSEAPVPIVAKRADTPPLLAELVMRCLEKEPDARPQTAADLVRTIDTVTSGGSLPAMPQILLGGRGRLWRGLALWAFATVGMALVARAATIVIGLPSWVYPGAIITMLLGLPVIFFTAFVHHGVYQAATEGDHTPGGTATRRSTWTRIAVKASPWVSWRHTARGGVLAIGAFSAAVLGFMVLRALGIGPAGSLLAAGKLGAREPLLVTDFHSRGGDSTLGDAVSETVRTDLAQSRVVSIVPSSRVADALTRMKEPATSHVDLALARQIAQREGIKGIVDGDLAPVGSGYLVTVRLIATESGTELASYHRTADGPKELIPVVDDLTRTLRGKIGESLHEVQGSPPLAQVTTSSLAALQKFTAGSHANDDGDWDRAIALLQEAISLDTTFAMAYRKLGVAMANANWPEETWSAAFVKAYQYREHLTERERLLTTASYYTAPGYDRQKELAVYDALLSVDSLDDVAVMNRGDLLQTRREFIRADSMYRREIVAKTSSVMDYRNLIASQIRQGKPASARAVLEEARQALGREADLAAWEVGIPFAEGKLDSIVPQLLALRRAAKSSWEPMWVTYRLADIALLRGHLRESARFESDAVAQDQARGAPAPPLTEALRAAERDIQVLRDRERGVQVLDAALAATPLRLYPPRASPYAQIAALYAAGGRADRARTVLAQYAADVRDTLVIRVHGADMHNARGELALAEGHTATALEEFRAGDLRPDGPIDACVACLPARLARTYDAAGLVDSAVVQYERFLTSPRIIYYDAPPAPFIVDAVWLARIHDRLGELYDHRGEFKQAVEHYNAFINLWKTADPELQPEVAAARQRVAVLQGQVK